MASTPAISIDHALTDPSLLGAALGNPESWRNWLVVLRAAFGQPLEHMAGLPAAWPAEIRRKWPRQMFRQLAGDRAPPEKRADEAHFVIGRRSGKSRMAAAVACYLACFAEHKLARGETGFIVVLSPTRAQSAIIFDYCQGFIEASPILRQQIDSISADEIRLTNGVVISVTPANYRTLRGRTLLAVIADESAFWRDENSAQPDVEVFRAAAPSLAASGGMWIAVSSPYAQRGLLYQRYRQHFGKSPIDAGNASREVLVIQAPTETFNPTIDLNVIKAAQADDPESAAAEWGGRFRSDLSTYVERKAIEDCIDAGVFERPFTAQQRYVAFCDPSGGSHDSMTLAISHREGERVTLDVIREVKAPFSPPDVVSEFARLLATYRVRTVCGDRYAGEWPAAAFASHGLRYVPSERSKSELYGDALPLFNSALVTLLDNTVLVNQLSRLERRTARGGRDSIDHPRGEFDDVANCVCGALLTAPARVSIPTGNRPRFAQTDYDILGGSSPANEKGNWNVENHR